jgi:hypothetical protein
MEGLYHTQMPRTRRMSARLCLDLVCALRSPIHPTRWTPSFTGVVRLPYALESAFCLIVNVLSRANASAVGGPAQILLITRRSL